MSQKQPRAVERKSPIDELLGKKVQVITSDSRVFVGILKGIDQTLNTILSQCVERIYSQEEPVQFQEMGLQVLRGDTIVTFGELDEQKDELLDFQKIYGQPLEPLIN